MNRLASYDIRSIVLKVNMEQSFMGLLKKWPSNMIMILFHESTSFNNPYSLSREQIQIDEVPHWVDFVPHWVMSTLSNLQSLSC